MVLKLALMKRPLSIIGIFLCVFLISCQKEIDWGTGGSGGSGGGGGSTSGDLLVKALQITPATSDTNTITFQWDTNKRLLVYNSSGKVNSIETDIHYSISRLTDGKISKIVAISSATAGVIDSIVYLPTYVTSSSKLAYVIDTEYSIIGQIIDSASYTYNSNGMVSSKETSTEILGFTIPSSKESYTYDGNGNVITITDYTANGVGGYDIAATQTYTYDSHKSSVTLGEESYIVIGAANISKNNGIKIVTNDVTGGQNYSGVFSQQQFNSNDRPTQSSLSVTPQPPGYDLKLLYYYQ